MTGSEKNGYLWQLGAQIVLLLTGKKVMFYVAETKAEAEDQNPERRRRREQLAGRRKKEEPEKEVLLTFFSGCLVSSQLTVGACFRCKHVDV